MSEIRVTNVLGENGNSPVNFTKGISMSGICTAPAFIPSQGQLSHRNIIVNGAMLISQRGTSSTTSGYATVDRFAVQFGGTDEAATQAQVDVASGTSPYTNGFRKALKITNGNQTGGAGAADYIRYRIRLEAQDIANSGWNYTSSSSYITLSFWIKSSVAQNFYGHLHAVDGTQQGYPFETGSLTANTWTKITKTIPGNSNLTFNNDNALGLEISIYGYLGTDYTASGVSSNAWAAWSSSTYTTDQTSTWWTTNDATLELTGVQLEVGSVATPFEHRSFGEEEDRCMRYYEEGSFSFRASGNIVRYCQAFNKRKRANPSMAVYYDSNKTTDGTINSGNSNNSGWSRSPTGKNGFNIEKNTGSNGNGVDFAGYYTADSEL